MLGMPSVCCSIQNKQHDDSPEHQSEYQSVNQAEVHIKIHADHAPTRDGESIRRQPGPRGRVKNKPTVCSTMVKK